MSRKKNGHGCLVQPLLSSRHFSIVFDYRGQPTPPISAVHAEVAGYLKTMPLVPRQQLTGTLVEGRRLVAKKHGILSFPSVTYSGTTTLEPGAAIPLLQGLASRLVLWSSAGAQETEAIVIFGDYAFSITPDPGRQKG